MQKRLPVNKNHNMTATFEHALPMSVILAEPKLKNWVDENFINVCTVRFVDNFNFDYCGNGVNYDYYAELFDFYAIVFLDHKYLAGDPSRTEGFIHSLVIYG